VKAATGEVVTSEELGGAEMHSRVSGVTDALAENDEDALQLARRAVGNLNRDKQWGSAMRSPNPPLYPAEELYSIIPTDTRKPFDVREIIARIVDGSEFDEFKKLYGATLVTGFARIVGYPVGIVANNGILFSESALKGAHFIQLCAQRGIPLIFLQNISGFMIGKRYEAGGIAKDGAKMVNAVACARVPKLTVIIGGSFGAGNYAMCGRAYEPRFLFTWPNHRIAVMGAQQLAGVMDIIKREAAAKAGQTLDEAKMEAARAALENQIQSESDCYFATARLWDDGIIDPRDTRTVIAISLSAACNRPVEGTMEWGVFRH
jgi:3-methylcrotonyl-CoA carboxylase beta subunit